MDEVFFRRALAVARTGRGITEPNPSVGCVLVKEGRIIGEGRSQEAGGKHAEPMAIADALARGESTVGATAYVTLEPCCHTNKRTPPCVPAVIAAGVSRIVVGCLDPNPAVNGEGLRQLSAAGVEVVRVSPELEAEAKQQIAPFTARTMLKRPYVTLKWAESADGLIAGPDGARRQISSPESMALVHRLRARCEAIMVGGETVRKDNPRLTVRDVPNARQPLRVLVTRTGIFPPDAAALGENSLVYHIGGNVTSLQDALGDLAQRGVSHLLVESGNRLAAALAKESLADRAWIFRAARPLGESGVRAISLSHWSQTAHRAVGGAVDADTLTERLNPASPVFFASVPSADFEQLT